MSRVLIQVALLVLSIGVVYGQSPDVVFDQANKAYQEGKFAEARDAYHSLLHNGYESADLYYNLGNAYYKTGDIGRAILNYERALRLRPGDDDIHHNLELANLLITDRIEPTPRLFLWDLWDGLKGSVSLDGATWFAYAAFCIMMASITGLVLSRSYRPRKYALISGLGTGILFIGLLVVFLGKLRDADRTDSAILVADIATVKNSPDEKSSDAFVLHKGVKVLITDSVGAWIKIRLADGKVGWMQSQSAEVI